MNSYVQIPCVQEKLLPAVIHYIWVLHSSTPLPQGFLNIERMGVPFKAEHSVVTYSLLFCHLCVSKLILSTTNRASVIRAEKCIDLWIQ